MTPDLVREIIASGSAMLSSMAQAAKTTGEHLYGVLVRQQIIEGIGSLFSLTILIISGFLIVKYITLPLWKSSEKAYDKQDIRTGICILTGILIAVACGITIFIGDAVKHILNPEFYALQFIFDSVKGK